MTVRSLFLCSWTFLFTAAPRPPDRTGKPERGDDGARPLLYYFVCMEIISKTVRSLLREAQKKSALG